MISAQNILFPNRTFKTSTVDTSAIIYEGPSSFDGELIVVIVTGLQKPGKKRTSSLSQNGKTGRMAQTWILKQNENPFTAVRNKTDSTVCGDCPLRGGQGCYVLTQQGPATVWKAYKAGKYAPRTVASVSAQLRATGQGIRLGSYGDPYAAPLHIWHNLVLGARRWTGYTHQWRRETAGVQALRHILDASCETDTDEQQAREMGWSVFRTRTDGELGGGIQCPASKEYRERTGKAVTCDQCGLCSGTSRGQRTKVIQVHGGAVQRRAATRTVNRLQLE